MKISEYIAKKQKLLEAAGVTTILVPEDQIDDSVEQVALSLLDDSSICPYCQVFVNHNWDCDGCPMYEADNECNADYFNTYSKVRDERKGLPLTKVLGIDELVEQYNKELKES